jgi:hypothetical protein
MRHMIECRRRGDTLCKDGVIHTLMLMLWCIECDAHADEHMMLVHTNI